MARKLRIELAEVRKLREAAARRSGLPDLDKLNDDQLVQYRRWRDLRDRWDARFDDEPSALYATTINGNPGPQMPAAIHTALFGPTPTITEDDTPAQAGEKYRRYLER